VNFKEKYNKIKSEAPHEVLKSQNAGELDKARSKYIGRKGVVTSLFKELGGIPHQERPLWGKKLNSLKKEIENLIEKQKNSIRKEKSKKEFFDPTLPVEHYRYPGRNPAARTMDEITSLFISMGFGVAYGPEIETEYNNFTALNFPKDHPARDMQDTFYVDENWLLRTHTSPVQIRVMKESKPPVKLVAPGKCYRRDTLDASHLPVFHQVEGLMIDRKISFSHLKGVLECFTRKYFGGKVKTRFRPSFFPFTEPSAEVDISCTICMGKGCSSCSGKGWLEILGAGMVDPNVLENCGIDKNKWQGFAFGMGVERIAMLKYGIDDIRYFIQNDKRFLEQF